MTIDALADRLSEYLDDSQVSQVRQAYCFAESAHEGQHRASGEPYIHHPIEVARILADMRLDYETIVAAILHDVIEDTETAKGQIADEFGNEVADLVDGVSKMREVEVLEVPPGGSVELAPGGYHIMLMMPLTALNRAQPVVILTTAGDGSKFVFEVPFERR